MSKGLGNMSAIKGSCHLEDGKLLVELKGVDFNGQNRAVGFLFDENGKCYIIPILDGHQLPSKEIGIMEAIDSLINLEIITTNVINDNSDGTKGEPMEEYLSIVSPEVLEEKMMASLKSVVQAQDEDGEEEIHRGICLERMAMN